MKIGKVSGNVYKRSVLKEIHNENKKSTVLGEDCAFFVAEPMEIMGDSFISCAVYRALNLVKCPTGLKASLMMPETAEESELKKIIKTIDTICRAEKVVFDDAKVKVTDSVAHPILSCVVIGAESKDATLGKIHDGCDVVCTKWIGLSGTAIMAEEKNGELKEKFPTAFLEDAKSLQQLYSILPEAATAGKSGALEMMPVTEGGIFAALWELAEECGVGLEIALKRIPLKQETVELCEFFGASPYELFSDGSLLIVAEDGEEMVSLLEKEHIAATVIGKVRNGNDRVVINDEEKRFLEPAKPDEIYRIFKKRGE